MAWTHGAGWRGGEITPNRAQATFISGKELTLLWNGLNLLLKWPQVQLESFVNT